MACDKDKAIQVRCETIRTVCWTTIAVGFAATMVINALVKFKGLHDASKARKAAEHTSESSEDI